MINVDQIREAIPLALESIDIPELGEKTSGKVRDMYPLGGDKRILITTDRISGFDRVLGTVPHKGQVLTQLAVWWFDKLAQFVPNHLIDVPDPNVMVVREAERIPVEVVVRGYITGVTDTSLWTLYERGERTPYGIPLPEGLRKNEMLPENVITPTSKAATGHDRVLTREELLDSGVVDPTLWAKIEQVANKLFDFGQRTARAEGLILVDSKYEFGLVDGELTLIDEVHTPDSSRYWIASSHAKGNPDHVDKEYMRRWFAEHGYTGEGTPPAMPDDLLMELATRYIGVYERLTHHKFRPARMPADERIRENLLAYVNG